VGIIKMLVYQLETQTETLQEKIEAQFYTSSPISYPD
jgi:hypothetical protein